MRTHEPTSDVTNSDDTNSGTENSDDSVTSGSEDVGVHQARGTEDPQEASSSDDPSSSSDAGGWHGPDDTDEDSTDQDTDVDADTSMGNEQDMSFADRVARENRHSRRHQLSRSRAQPPARKASHEQKTEKADDNDDNKNVPKTKKAFSRDNKHRPVEMSSKKRVSVLRDATLGLGDGSGLMKKRHVRDPRFDSLGGEYSEKAFKKRYSFIFDEKLPEERRELKESLSKTKSDRKRERLQRQLQKITQQIKTEENRRKQEARRDKVIQRHKEATKGQTNKFHLKKSDIKKQELMLKYEELQASGGLERYMEKRRKRNAAKDHRYMPSGRQERK